MGKQCFSFFVGIIFFSVFDDLSDSLIKNIAIYIYLLCCFFFFLDFYLFVFERDTFVKMLDFFYILTKGGLVLWCVPSAATEFIKIANNAIDKSVLQVKIKYLFSIKIHFPFIY